MEEKQENLDVVKLSIVEKMVRQLKIDIEPREDCEISFEFIIGSLFPNVLKNIKNTFTQNYIAGYNAAKEGK